VPHAKPLEFIRLPGSIYNRLGRLIREGSRDAAVVRVTLLNTGEDAYKPEVYGREIKIERRIPKSGAAGYRLISVKGEVPSASA
jgi:hypothetical protein